MGEVVALPAKDTPAIYLWRCVCGCLSYYVRSDGELECAQCSKLASGPELLGGWRRHLPDPVGDETEPESSDLTVTDLMSSEAALRRVIGRADVGKTQAVFVVQETGEVGVWSDSIEGEAQVEWMKRRLADIEALWSKRIKITED